MNLAEWAVRLLDETYGPDGLIVHGPYECCGHDRCCLLAGMAQQTPPDFQMDQGWRDQLGEVIGNWLAARTT